MNLGKIENSIYFILFFGNQFFILNSFLREKVKKKFDFKSDEEIYFKMFKICSP